MVPLRPPSVGVCSPTFNKTKILIKMVEIQLLLQHNWMAILHMAIHCRLTNAVNCLPPHLRYIFSHVTIILSPSSLHAMMTITMNLVVRLQLPTSTLTYHLPKMQTLILRPINVNATPSPIPSPTLYSNYNYGTCKETFPIDVPAKANSTICSIILATSSIASPRPFQVFAIYFMVFLFSQIIYLIRKTGEGKSLVTMTIAVILCGVTIVMVPLLDWEATK